MIKNISKTKFIQGLNCPRFFYYYQEDLKKNNKLNEVNTLIEEERKNAILTLVNDSEEEPIEIFDDLYMDMMNVYFKKEEALTKAYLEYLFKEKVFSGENTYDQIKVIKEYKGYHFYAFLDHYQPLKSIEHIVETKGTTSKKFLDLKFKSEKKELPIFIKNHEGIYQTQKAFGNSINENYEKTIGKILNRENSVGQYLYDLTYQRWIIDDVFNKDKKKRYMLAVLNDQYIFDGVYKANEPDYLKDIKNDEFIISLFDVTDLTEMLLEKVKKDVEVVIDRIENKHYKDSKELCPNSKTKQCPYHDKCYKDFPKDNSILTYLLKQHGFKGPNGTLHVEDFIKEGKYHMLDVPYDYLKYQNQRIQYETVKTHQTYMNESRMKDIIKHLEYPLYHLDFESFPRPLPKFKGENPYSQSVFLYNLHIEYENGTLESHHFLARPDFDDRYDLIKTLLSQIQDKGHIIAWQDSFEKNVLKNFSELYPEFKEKIERLLPRVYDLSYIFRGYKHPIYESWGLDENKGINYYHEKLNGSFSIKKVLPIFEPNLTYDNLLIKNGVQAYIYYDLLSHMSKEDENRYKNALITYCHQDTLAMVKILRQLKETLSLNSLKL